MSMRQLAASAGLALAAGTSLAQTYTQLPSGFTPQAISADGLVVAGFMGNSEYPAYWTSGTGVVQLKLPGNIAVTGKAWSASADGSTIVGTYRPPGGVQAPFVWTAATDIVGLTTVTGTANSYCVSDDGDRVVGQGNVDGVHGFTWTSSGGAVGLTPPSGVTAAWGTAISPDGRFATGVGSLPGGLHAVALWDFQLGTATLLQDISAAPLMADSNDINADGTAAVGSARLGGKVVAVYIRTDEVIPLAMPSGFDTSVARAMTPDARWIVGSMDGPTASTTGFIFTQGLGMISLRTWIQARWGVTIPEPTGASAITPDRRAIVGGGRSSTGGVFPGWIIRVPAENPADFNGDGFVDFFDLDAFIECFEGDSILPQSSADLNHDGFVDFFDLDLYFSIF